MLTKQAILSRARHVDLPCTELGDTVRIRRLRAGELLSFTSGGTPPAEGQLRMVAAAVIGEDGSPLFSEEDLRGMDATAYLALSRLVRQANGLDEDAAKK